MPGSSHAPDELGEDLRDLIASVGPKRPARPLTATLRTHQAPISALTGAPRRRGLGEPMAWSAVALLQHSKNPVLGKIGRWAAIGTGQVSNHYLLPAGPPTEEARR